MVDRKTECLRHNESLHQQHQIRGRDPSADDQRARGKEGEEV
jgi:hypothetical protein